MDTAAWLLRRAARRSAGVPASSIGNYLLTPKPPRSPGPHEPVDPIGPVTPRVEGGGVTAGGPYPRPAAHFCAGGPR